MAKLRFRESHGYWIANYVDNQGIRHQVKAGRVKAQAEETLNKILAELHKERIDGPSQIDDKFFSEFVTEYKKYSEKNKRPTTYHNEKFMADIISKQFGSRKISQITVKDIQRYKDQLSSEVSPATVNRKLALLKNMFNKAMEWGYAKDNPVKKVKLFKENNARVRYLNQNEYQNLLIHCDKTIKPFVIIALHTGMRKSELLNLTWNDVNLEKNYIHVAMSKNGDGRYIPIGKTTRETLEDLAKVKHINNNFVFYEMLNFRRLWEKAVKDASVQNFHFHDCRHSFASNAVMSGMDLRTLQEILGHKTILMTLRYSHLSQSHKMAAMQKMDQFTNNSDKTMEASG